VSENTLWDGFDLFLSGSMIQLKKCMMDLDKIWYEFRAVKKKGSPLDGVESSRWDLTQKETAVHQERS
jgi:hypothetical protein